MKLSIRLLFTIPLILFTYFYLRFSLASNGCSGLMDLFFGTVFIVLFIISIRFAIRGIFYKRGSNKAEPVTLIITLMTTAVLIIGKIFGQDFKGKKWIYAEANTDKTISQALLLRTNGTFRVDLKNVDYSCYYSGDYQRHKDTILLDGNVIIQTNSLLANKYLLQDTFLIPLNNANMYTTKFSRFTINYKR